MSYYTYVIVSHFIIVDFVGRVEFAKPDNPFTVFPLSERSPNRDFRL